MWKIVRDGAFHGTEGVDVNRKDSVGGTPLHYAAFDGNETTVRLLLQRGAKTSAKDNRGETALQYAALGGHYDKMAKLLLDNSSSTPSRRQKME